VKFKREKLSRCCILISSTTTFQHRRRRRHNSKRGKLHLKVQKRSNFRLKQVEQNLGINYLGDLYLFKGFA